MSNFYEREISSIFGDLGENRFFESKEENRKSKKSKFSFHFMYGFIIISIIIIYTKAAYHVLGKILPYFN